MTTPTPRTPAHDEHPAFIPYSGLYSLLQRAAPRYVGCDEKNKKILYAATQTDLNSIETNADCVLTSFASGLRGLGMLMAYCPRGEIPDSTWRDIADLIALLSEAQLILADLQQIAREGAPATLTTKL